MARGLLLLLPPLLQAVHAAQDRVAALVKSSELFDGIDGGRLADSSRESYLLWRRGVKEALKGLDFVGVGAGSSLSLLMESTAVQL